MASDGKLAFASGKQANAFVKDTLAKALKTVKLTWSNTRIDPLTDQMAVIGSDFTEEVTSASDSTATIEGYFSGTVICGDKGWRIRNAHWSEKASK